MGNTMNDTRTPGEILADAVKLAEKTGHSYITVTNQCAERIIELLENEEELGEELGNAVELIRKKDERIKKLLKEQPHWIPISERKPKCNDVYIVSRWVSDGCAKKMLSDVAYFDGTDTWYDDYETVYDPDRIVAWMPLPEPYRTDT